jgi:acyl-CoA reductase-like NAD-dependent aldehyde dehydrogenase
VIATAGVYDELVARLVPAVRSLRMGDPATETGLDLGPVISAAHQARVLDFVAGTSGEVLAGGHAGASAGFFVEPTLVADPRQDEPIVQQEVFGPLVTVQRARDEAEALRWANDVPFGLASSVWTRDVSTALQASRHLDFGCVWINDHLPVTAEMPHGGFKQSGYGKDMSMYGLEDYTRIKHVMARVKERIATA